MSKIRRLLNPHQIQNEAILSLFTCKKQIGKGVTSRVYKMTHNINHKSYALKEVGMYDRENIECVFKEKRIKHILHTNLLTYEYLFTGNRPTDLKNIKRFDSEDSRPSSTVTNENEGSGFEDEIMQVVDVNYYDYVYKGSECSNENLKCGYKALNRKKGSKKEEFSKVEKMDENACSEFNAEGSAGVTEDMENKTFGEYFKRKDRRYCYFISEYCEFTLRDFIDLRNDYYFNNRKSYSEIKSKSKKHEFDFISDSCVETIKKEEKDAPIMCFCDIEGIAGKNDYTCNKIRSASVDHVKNIKLKNIDKTGKITNFCKSKQNKPENEPENIIENHFANQLHNNKVVSYDTYGIKKRIPSCYLKASFTPDMKVNSMFFLKIIKELLNGLMFLHSYYIAHNDIKASNIFFNDDLVPKIGDFGMVICGNEKENFFFDHCLIKYKYKDKLPIDEMNNDLKQIGFLLFEMLWPMKTAMEKYKLVSDLENNLMFPEGFVTLFPEEYLLIKACMTSATGVFITAESIYEFLEELQCK